MKNRLYYKKGMKNKKKIFFWPLHNLKKGTGQKNLQDLELPCVIIK